jgi:hypothetical protein
MRYWQENSPSKEGCDRAEAKGSKGQQGQGGSEQPCRLPIAQARAVIQDLWSVPKTPGGRGACKRCTEVEQTPKESDRLSCGSALQEGSAFFLVPTGVDIFCLEIR